MSRRPIIVLVLLTLTVSICQSQIVPEGTTSSANFANVNMSQLMTDLGLTEQDIKDMQSNIEAQNSNSNGTTTNNNTAGSVQGQSAN
jgi:peptidoglycan hydrolase CwlO-like protein